MSWLNLTYIWISKQGVGSRCGGEGNLFLIKLVEGEI